MTNIDICHHCTERRMVELDGRTVTCHAVCPDYKKLRSNRDAELKADYEQQQLIAGYIGDKIKRSKT